MKGHSIYAIEGYSFHKSFGSIHSEHSWNIKANPRRFMDDLGKKLGFTGMDDWYNLTADDILKNGGSTLMNKHGSSPFKLIQSIYPEHSWDMSKMNSKPMG